MSLYNKYRPNTFNDLKHKAFGEHFKLSHHAYLFFGPPGTGKTSAVRLCMASENSNQNTEVIAGKHPDYFEINCAVNNGVDAVREIISHDIYTPAIKSKQKFICFDETHMLTPQAQNALLKIVEEPPNHVKFFFCTTEVQKVLPAIRSRCQIVPFLKLSNNDLESILINVCNGENIKYDPKSIQSIISFADGSARTAINLLEQCLAIIDDHTQVNNALGTANEETFISLTESFMSKDRVKLINSLEEIINNSIDPNSVFNKYADFIADLIILRLNNPSDCKYDGKALLLIAEALTNILKDFKILQNIKLIAKIHFLKAIERN